MRPIHLSTLLAPRLSCLLSYINSLSQRFAGKGHTIFFALSANFESSNELEGAVSALRAMGLGETGHKGKSRVVGCLSGSLSEVDILGLKGRCGLSCAIAIFDSTRCVPFYSGLPGRKEVQVGRWHSFRKTEVGEKGGENVDLGEGNGDGKRVDWDTLWNRRMSSGADLLPEELRSIPSSRIHSLLYMSAPHPDVFTSALSDHFLSTSTCLGLIAAPTHFVTGRAVTLFCDEKIYGDGAVGLALLEGEHGATVPEVRTEFVGVQRLGGRMAVTSKEGNMVNSLDNSNPTGLLLRAIDIAGISYLVIPSQTFRGDDEFALGVVSPAGNITRTYKITAGDPAHRGGSISLDAVQAPAEGAVVQFLYRTSTSRAQLPLSLLSSTTLISSTNPRSSMAFLTVPDSNHPAPTSYSDVDPVPLHLQNTFLAASSTGFILSRGRHPIGTNLAISSTKLNAQYNEPWLCSLPGGMATFEWTDNVRRPDV